MLNIIYVKKERRNIMEYYCRVIPTAGGNLYMFRNMEVYRRLFSANTELLMILPKMNIAG